MSRGRKRGILTLVLLVVTGCGDDDEPTTAPGTVDAGPSTTAAGGGSDASSRATDESLVLMVRGSISANVRVARRESPGHPSGTVDVPTSPRISPIEENHTTVDDRTRLNLHRKLEAVLGHDDADTLMAHLPPVTWNEVATKDDVRGSEAALRNDIDAAVGRLGIELRAEMQVLGSELRTEMHVLGSSLRTEFVEATNRQIKWLVTFGAAWTTVLLTLARLVG